MALSSTFPAHKPRTSHNLRLHPHTHAQGSTGEALKASLTFYSSEEEECNYSVVESTSGLGDTGQDGKRVQKVTVRRAGKNVLHIYVLTMRPILLYLQCCHLQRNVVHLFGSSNQLQTVKGVPVRFQGKFLLSELKMHSDIKLFHSISPYSCIHALDQGPN